MRANRTKRKISKGSIACAHHALRAVVKVSVKPGNLLIKRQEKMFANYISHR